MLLQRAEFPSLFILFYFILPAHGPSCSAQDLRCVMWDPSLCRIGSPVAVHGLACSEGCGIPVS